MAAARPAGRERAGMNFLCNPVDKNGEDSSAANHLDHLMCYHAKRLDAGGS